MDRSRKVGQCLGILIGPRRRDTGPLRRLSFLIKVRTGIVLPARSVESPLIRLGLKDYAVAFGPIRGKCSSSSVIQHRAESLSR